MGQLTIILDSEIEKKMYKIVKSSNLTPDKWIAKLIEEKVSSDWPESVVQLAGAWKDFPTAEELRQTDGIDAKREEF